MKKSIKLLTIKLLALTIFGCSSDENMDNTQPEKEANIVENPIKSPETPSTSTPTPTPNPSSDVDTAYTDETDRAFFKQISGFTNIYDKKEIISDYKFEQYPMYYIQTTGINIDNFSETGKAVKGFVINPLTKIEGAQKLGKNESFGLNIYRLDREIKRAEKLLKSPEGNGIYDTFNIDGNNYYLQKYSKIRVIGLNGAAEISLASHEAFHFMYQNSSVNSNWRSSWPNWIQNTEAFPFTKEVVELQILLSEILKDFPNITDKNIIRKKMKQYIAIRSKAIEIDPSPQKLLKLMSLPQERVEGGAHYIEAMASREFFNNKDSFWSQRFGIPLQAENKKQLKDMLSFGFFYSSGASVMFGINVLDKSKMAEYNSKTPFDIISGMIPMNASEKTEALKAAKASVNWKLIQETATKFTK